MHKGEHIFGAVVNLMHEQADLGFIALALRDVAYDAGEIAFAVGTPFCDCKFRDEYRAILSLMPDLPAAANDLGVSVSR